jgi:hypothetical protein
MDVDGGLLRGGCSKMGSQTNSQPSTLLLMVQRTNVPMVSVPQEYVSVSQDLEFELERALSNSLARAAALESQVLFMEQLLQRADQEKVALRHANLQLMTENADLNKDLCMLTAHLVHLHDADGGPKRAERPQAAPFSLPASPAPSEAAEIRAHSAKPQSVASSDAVLPDAPVEQTEPVRNLPSPLDSLSASSFDLPPSPVHSTMEKLVVKSPLDVFKAPTMVPPSQPPPSQLPSSAATSAPEKSPLERVFAGLSPLNPPQASRIPRPSSGISTASPADAKPEPKAAVAVESAAATAATSRKALPGPKPDKFSWISTLRVVDLKQQLKAKGVELTGRELKPELVRGFHAPKSLTPVV